jgi:beta-lactamase superfamily II metal-dependent hydrolase
VRFEFLHPPPGWESARRNNQSCVLRVETGASAMLLTGDIERFGCHFWLIGLILCVAYGGNGAAG